MTTGNPPLKNRRGLSNQQGPLQYDQLDIAVIDREHPVLDAEAMCGLPIFEDSPGRYASEQMAAFGRRRDPAYLRQLDLELMAR